MDIAELLGRNRADDASDLPENFSVPDYPPGEDADASPAADLLEPDPKPSREARGRKMRPSTTPAKKATAQEKRQIRDALSMMMLTLGGGMAFRDPVCGGAITEHADNIAEKAVPLIARNPAWVEWFCGSTGFLDILGLLIALRPVGATVWSHHVSHSTDAGGAHADYTNLVAPDL
jgi:hypothetical protein